MYRYMKVKQLEAAITTIYIGYWNFGNDQLINWLISESAQYYCKWKCKGFKKNKFL